MITGKNTKTRNGPRSTPRPAPDRDRRLRVTAGPGQAGGQSAPPPADRRQVRVAVAVTFTPAGGHAYTEEKTLRFHLPRRR